jgi:hypothetical protein
MWQWREELLYLVFSQRGLGDMVFCFVIAIWIRLILPLLRDAMKTASHNRWRTT